MVYYTRGSSGIEENVSEIVSTPNLSPPHGNIIWSKVVIQGDKSLFGKMF